MRRRPQFQPHVGSIRNSQQLQALKLMLYRRQLMIRLTDRMGEQRAQLAAAETINIARHAQKSQEMAAEIILKINDLVELMSPQTPREPPQPPQILLAVFGIDHDDP